MTEREKQEMNSGSDSKSEAPPHKMKKLNSEPTSRNLGQFLFFFSFFLSIIFLKGVSGVCNCIF